MKTSSKARHAQQLPKRLFRKLRLGRIRRRYLLIGGCTAASAIIWFGLIGFFLPSNLTFSLSKPTCSFNPLPLPRLTSQQSSATYRANSEPLISVGGYPLFSHKTCVQAVEAPSPENTEVVELAPFNNPLFKKKITVTSESLAAITADFAHQETVGTASPLSFKLDKADRVFDYEILVGDAQTSCEATDGSLTCPLKSLELSQGKTYPLILKRSFDSRHSAVVYEGAIKTLDPIVIKGSSIKNDSVVYGVPTDIKLTASKKIGALEGAGLFKAESDERVADAVPSFTDNNVVVTLASPLERDTTYELKLGQLQAEDGSQLTEPYKLSFTVSGGPKVASASIGTGRVQPSANISLNFDVELKSGQNLTNFIRVELGGKSIPATLIASGKTVTINPSSNLPACRSFTVRVSAGLISKYDIGDGEAWQLNSRTLCQVAFSIGRSVQGRSITAYRFGNGSSRIMFIGGVHGNETSSINTMNAFINYLEDHSSEIPAHRSIIIIPLVNPDGYAMGRRTNANNVDLNRNFPANDWRSAVQMPGGQNLPHGGGKAPLDQPESAAVAAFINQNRPRFVLTYHAVAGVIISNDAGDSPSLGRDYASRSGLRFTTSAGTDDEFGYATTGELEDWLVDKKGIPGILVEQTSMYYNQFPTHQNAIMNAVKLP